MKQRFKRILSLALSMAMLSMLTVGCGSDSGQAQSIGDTNAAESSSGSGDAGETTEAAAEEEGWTEPVTLTYWAFNNEIGRAHV